jgi:hypothetical protein
MPTINELFGAVVTSAVCMVSGCAPVDDAEVSGDPETLAQQANAVDLTGTWGVAPLSRAPTQRRFVCQLDAPGPRCNRNLR